MTEHQVTQLNRSLNHAEGRFEDNVSPLVVFNAIRQDLVKILEDDTLVLYDE